MKRQPLSTSKAARGVIAAFVLCALFGCAKSPAKSGATTESKVKELRTLRIDEPLPESPQGGVLSHAPITHYALLERLAELARTRNVSAVLLQLGDMHGAWGQATDLEEALAALKQAGKPLHCHFESTDNVGFALLARVCDRISIAPGGFLNLVGVSADLVYARELLQTLGVRAELVQIGRFKGAADPLTRDDMPVEVGETMNAILDELQGELVGAVAKGRKLAPERVQQLIDAGPFTAEQARAAGLVDAVNFDDEARNHAKLAGKAERIVPETLGDEEQEIGLGDLLHALTSKKDEEEPKGERVVLAYLDGTIMRGGEHDFQSGHADPFVQAMRKFADDKAVKAVVLRIDSPGGSALASDLMWHAVRRVAKRKPVIVSVGDMAASGGYYIASAGTEILAQDRALVGSIGVVGGKIVVQDLAERLGVNVQHLGRGKNAGWTSPLRKWSSEQRGLFEGALRESYERFLSRIEDGRKRTRAQIEPFAQGRLMTGRKARAGGLVDRKGGIVAALSLARERGHLPKDAEVQVWPGQPGLFQALSQLASSEVETKTALLAPLLAPLSRDAAGLVELLLSDDGLRGAAVLPYTLSFQ